MGRDVRGRRYRMRDLSHSVVVALILTIIALAVTTTPGDATTFAARTLDGGNNNLAHPAWGRAGTLYLRVAPRTMPMGSPAWRPVRRCDTSAIACSMTWARTSSRKTASLSGAGSGDSSSITTSVFATNDQPRTLRSALTRPTRSKHLRTTLE